ncbi:MAG: AEC family transporter [Clostridia bacterium]
MELSLIVLKQVIIMLLIMIIGAICYKTKIITLHGNKQLSDIVLLVVTPALIIFSYQVEYNNELAKGLAMAFVLAVISHILGIVVSVIFIRGKENRNLAIERFSVVYTNCGFMGLPLIFAVFGATGAFLASAYVTVFNILVWTHGLITLTSKKDLKSYFKVLLNPVIISVAIGLIMFFCKIRLPGVLYQTTKYLADLNMPLAMLVAGVYIGKSSISSAFKGLRSYYVQFVRLLIIPFFMLIILKLLNISDTLLIVNLIATACPSATIVIMFATKFDKDAIFATKTFILSTLFSVITIPFWVFVAKLIM